MSVSQMAPGPAVVDGETGKLVESAPMAGVPAKYMGALPGQQSTEQAAHWLGLHSQTVLLLGGGLVTGWVLNNSWRAANRTAKRTGRRLRSFFSGQGKNMSKPGPGISVGRIALYAVVIGGGYYLYRRLHDAAPVVTAAAPQALAPKPAAGLPRLVNGHWQRPGPVVR